MNEYRINNISIPVADAYKQGLDQTIKSKLSQMLGNVSFSYKGLLRKSIDARRKSNVKFIVSALISTEAPINEGGSVFKYNKYKYIKNKHGEKRLNHRPLVIGSGPAGLFSAYILAIHGFSPIVLERGSCIEKRRRTVKKFWSGGDFDPYTNVQFGEGGAGTFSDGKLVTRINDPRGDFVLEKLAAAGAGNEILYEARPHIGTERLSGVIRNIREEIKKLGGTFMFDTRLVDIRIDGDRLVSVRTDTKGEIPADVMVAAIGHSARDTYEMLLSHGIPMEQKPFSMGLRIEHLQEDVNLSQWGNDAEFIDDSAEYSGSVRMDNGNAYTFCMCPGGVVVNASSEINSLVVNGMSYSGREGRNANCAWVAEVGRNCFPSSHPLAGVEIQREVEKAAFNAGGLDWSAPVQRLGNFMEGKKSSSFGRIKPSFTGNTTFCDLNDILPPFISTTLRSSLSLFSKKLPFFADPDAILTGCETRTSSPVRILRSTEYCSEGAVGIYPAGEGAGYAGGIMSAAVDGIKVAEAIVKMYNYPDE